MPSMTAQLLNECIQGKIVVIRNMRSAEPNHIKPSFYRLILPILTMSFVFIAGTYSLQQASTLERQDKLIAQLNLEVQLFTLNDNTYAKGRYKAGLVCKDKGWEFCASWANLVRSPGSRIA
ncbi:hypothetical protein [Shewanella pneumatophori]|uniref:Uncharacterized protein n=1 Tax=Shewanella pneumatophori TaxID=314092 RepID=A0A9X1ZB86_9GAMM|nr:hypothetical protein [Shewanella pneumatophori]MCL1137265.1 hypothetical protein [Shewanella pneumatophori]